MLKVKKYHLVGICQNVFFECIAMELLVGLMPELLGQIQA
jgi:hypothetical protein